MTQIIMKPKPWSSQAFHGMGGSVGFHREGSVSAQSD